MAIVTLKQYLWIFFISMIPLVELRGAIPVSQGFGLPLISSYIVCIAGNMLPVPFIYFFARKVLEWGKDKKFIGKFFSWCLEKGHKGGEKLKSKAGMGLFAALILFVGIPVPGTGAWTGTLASSILDMGFKKSVCAVLLGVLLAGLIMAFASAGVLGAIRSFGGGTEQIIQSSEDIGILLVKNFVC
ncbi:MAG: COG2426 family protein [Treponemataceae bacterium]